MLLSMDQERYNNSIMHLNNLYVQGDKKAYPADMMAMVSLLKNRQGDVGSSTSPTGFDQASFNELGHNPNIKCWHCGVFGHPKSKCPLLKSEADGGSSVRRPKPRRKEKHVREVGMNELVFGGDYVVDLPEPIPWYHTGDKPAYTYKRKTKGRKNGSHG